MLMSPPYFRAKNILFFSESIETQKIVSDTCAHTLSEGWPRRRPNLLSGTGVERIASS